MVGEFGEVQVMDWGLAKCSPLAPREDSSVGGLSTSPDINLTQHGAILGTPGYMAPEQARGEALDARADVFALGSILAAILTGQPAFVGNTVQETVTKAATADLTDVLTRLDMCGAEQELLALAKNCLAADTAERLSDARQVAAEVAAYRAGVETRLRQAETAKALVREAEQRKRRRHMRAASAVVLATLTIGLAASLWQMQRAIVAEELAKTERDAKAKALEAETAARLAETAAKEDADEKRRDAEKRLAQIEKGVDLFAGMVSSINPRAEEQGGDPLYVQLRTRAEQAADELDAESVGNALAVARLQTILGNTLCELGSYAKAVEVLEKARRVREQELGGDHPDTLTSMGNLALGYAAAGKLDLALPLYEETLKLRKSTLGADHRDTLESMSNLAIGYCTAGKLDLALPFYEETLELMKFKLGTDHLDTLTSMNNLALGYEAAGKLDLALPHYEETLKLTKFKLGTDHPNTLSSMNNLAAAYRAAGKLNLALPLYEETLKLRKSKLGSDHPFTLNSMGNLAMAYCEARRAEQAVPLFLEYLDQHRKRVKPDDAKAVSEFGSRPVFIAQKLQTSEQFSAAETCLREARTLLEKSQAWDKSHVQSLLGASLAGQRKFDEAESLLLAGYEGLKQREETIPEKSKKFIPEAIDRLIELYTATDKPDEVARWQAEWAKYPMAKRLE